ncbi:hypothetical protein LE181_22515 [Streptomyces sp. SCA3-4]|uniref:hypothetical protein n=1 Tax=Streptomyces sichuanensis TaxID=2871810 RepID=UPI001CE2E1F5|nr:hypothetical protein [Streptomyces sichuanensis]MCA6094933.1 hypothetical protein [Streptomyces sichuanensis]
MSFGQGGPQGAPGDQPSTPPWGPPPHAPQAPQGSPQPPAPQPLPQIPPGAAPGAPWQQQIPGQAATPDWGRLADETAARGRRRTWLLAGGGVLAAGAIAAIVATAVMMSGKGDDKALPSPEKLPSASAGSPEPTFSQVAPPNPREFIATEEKDTAPLSTKTLFPHTKPVLDKRTYKRLAQDTTTDCASAAQGGLGQVLADNGCQKVLRSTYERDGVAVTVGVAVFADKAAADKAKEQATGNITALSGDDGPAFCRATACRLTANAEGRYAYFTVAGYTNGSAVTSDDTKALQAGRDVAGYTFRRIMYRANALAAASVSPKPSAKPSAKASDKGSDKTVSDKPQAKPSPAPAENT